MIKLRTMDSGGWPAVERIYRDGIETGHATFEAEPPPTWNAFITGKPPALCLVGIDGDVVVGDVLNMH